MRNINFQKVQSELSDLKTISDSFLKKIIVFAKFATKATKKSNIFIATLLFQLAIVLPIAISLNNFGIILMGLIIHFIIFKMILRYIPDMDIKHLEFSYALELMLEEKASRK
jgi:hypothetical protein